MFLWQLKRLLGEAVCVRAKLLQSCLTLCNPVDCSPPSSSVHGILQARTLEWVAISFSNAPVQFEDRQACGLLGGKLVGPGPPEGGEAQQPLPHHLSTSPGCCLVPPGETGEEAERRRGGGPARAPEDGGAEGHGSGGWRDLG